MHFYYTCVSVVLGPAQSIHKYITLVSAVQRSTTGVLKFASCQSNQKQYA